MDACNTDTNTPTQHGMKIRFANAEPLTLYLETEEEARVWHSKLLAIAGTSPTAATAVGKPSPFENEHEV